LFWLSQSVPCTDHHKPARTIARNKSGEDE
jgi:hypothetical protein